MTKNYDNSGGQKKKQKNKKVSSRKSNVGTPKRILVKKFLKNSHYFYLSNETNRLRPSILQVGAKPKKSGNTLVQDIDHGYFCIQE